MNHVNQFLEITIAPAYPTGMTCHVGSEYRAAAAIDVDGDWLAVHKANFGTRLPLHTDASSRVYFPTDAIVALICVTEHGAPAEIAAVGNEGIVGISLFMGGGTTPSRGLVQSAGHGLCYKGMLMKDESTAVRRHAL